MIEETINEVSEVVEEAIKKITDSWAGEEMGEYEIVNLRSDYAGNQC